MKGELHMEFFKQINSVLDCGRNAILRQFPNAKNSYDRKMISVDNLVTDMNEELCDKNGGLFTGYLDGLWR